MRTRTTFAMTGLWILAITLIPFCSRIAPAQETGTPSPMPTPTTTPTLPPASQPVHIQIGSASGSPGDNVQITVSLVASGAVVAATGNDVTFNAQVLNLAPSGCRVNPALTKSLNVSTVSSDGVTTTIRVFVQATQSADPIPDGPLYSCTFHIASGALPGTYSLDSDLAIAFHPDATQIVNVTGTGGAVVVTLFGGQCTGDCDGNGSVTVNELLEGVNIALGTRPLADCASFDANGDGTVSVNELILAVGNALTRCLLPPTPVPTATPTPTPTPISIFVRMSGSDANGGASPADALRSIAAAVKVAMSGYRIVVGPGTYMGGVTTDRPGPNLQDLQFVADVDGTLTGDAPGPVLIDASTSALGNGFKISGSPGALIDGFTITGATDAGIAVKSGSDELTVRNCTIFNNPGAGIRVQDSADALLFNNLIYGNGSLGIGLVGVGSGSPNARVFNNTIVGNGDHGLTIGTTQVASPGALVRNNIIQDNSASSTPALENIKVFTKPASDLGYDEDFNLVFPPSYGPANLAGTHDVNLDADFTFAAGDDFHLRPGSPAINAGDSLPPSLEAALFSRTTTGVTLDGPPLDLGFHFPP